MADVPLTPDVPEAGLVAALFGEREAAARDYAALLVTRGVEWGLVGPREVARIWSRHVLNSLAVAPLIGEGLSVIDVGSGAGLPGSWTAANVVDDLARPDLGITLLEPLERRYDFLCRAVSELGLDARVRVRRGRAEDVRRETWDVVTGRAVAPLEKLVRWTSPLFLPGGTLVALKGRSAEAEVTAAAGFLRRSGLTADMLGQRSGRAQRLRRSGLTADVLVVRAHPDTEPTRVIRVVKSS